MVLTQRSELEEKRGRATGMIKEIILQRAKRRAGTPRRRWPRGLQSLGKSQAEEPLASVATSAWGKLEDAGRRLV